MYSRKLTHHQLPSHAGLVETLQLDAANLSSNIQQQVRGHNEGGCTPRVVGMGTRGSGGHRHHAPGLFLTPAPRPARRWRTWAWPR